MQFDFVRFCQDHNIDYATEGHKHCQPGWIQVECPFCTGNPGYHLGFNIENGYFNCWRCRFKHATEVISKLTNCTKAEAINILREYKGHTRVKKTDKIDKTSSKIKFPAGTTDLQKMHRKYILSRGYSPKKIQKVWGQLYGTGFYGAYKYRLIIPIIFNGKLISYQGRDITGKQELRYKNCPKPQEVKHIKDVVYGYDQAYGGDSVVVCEGVMDVWRLGPGSVATFGIDYTRKQVMLIGRSFKNRFIFYDSADRQALVQANKLAESLSIYPGKIEVIKCTESDDPGELSDSSAKKIMKELLG